MQLIRSGEHSLGHGIGAGDDQLVAGEIELLDGEGHERQIVPVPVPGAGEPLDERGSRGPAPQEVPLLLRDEVDQAEEIGLGIQNEQLLQHPLGAGVGHQPIVDNGDLHGSASCSRKPRVFSAQLSQL